MKFGKVESIQGIDLSLPENHIDNKEIIKSYNYLGTPNIYIGCSGWTKKTLNNFFPRGTKDELTYYSSQINAIEMNASFYRIFSPEQFKKWKEKTDDSFMFFPKVFQGISHWKRLKDAKQYITEYSEAVLQLEEKLGMCFLQMHNNFAPTEDNLSRLTDFCAEWPAFIPLAIEVRHPEWFTKQHNDALAHILKAYNMPMIITDTAGRRDVLHSRLTSNTAFVRFVGSNHDTDFTRAEEWAVRIAEWAKQGIENIYFFVHQNNDELTVELTRHFIQKVNEAMNINHPLPRLLNQSIQQTLF